MRALFALVCAALALPAAGNETGSEVFARAAPSVFSIGVIGPAGDARIGSGVAIAPGRVVTNLHVVREARSIYIKQGEQSYEALLETGDERRDLALLGVSGLSAPVPALASGERAAIGQTVYAIGSPRGLELSLSQGIVSALRRTDEGVLIQTTAPISPGSSGGGLFDAQGRLLGLTTAQVLNGQNLNFAIPVEWLRSLGLDLAIAAETGPAPETTPLPAPEPVAPAPVAAPAAETAEAVETAAAEEKKKPGGNLWFASLLILALLFGAKPAIRWLSDYLSDDSLPAPVTARPAGAPRAAPVDRVAPFRAAAREELKQARDETAWQAALLQAGGDEARAAVEYVEQRAYAQYRADLDRKWAEAQAQSQMGPARKT